MKMAKIYKKLAKAYGVSVAEVKRNMQEAINAAYINPTFHAECVHREGEIPTTEEFLAHMVRRIAATT